MTSLEKDVSSALRIDDVDKPAAAATDTPATPNSTAGEVQRGRAGYTDRRRRRFRRFFTRPMRMRWLRSRWRSCRKRKTQAAPQEKTEPAAPDVLKDAKAS